MCIHTRCSWNKGPLARYGFLLFALIVASPVMARAADTGRNEFQPILQESLEAIWTGQEFTPGLKQRQQELQTLLATGGVQKAEIESAMEKIFLSLLNQHQTSRYILKTFPERINGLFSSQMDWKRVKEIMWRAMSSPVKKEDPVTFKVGTLAPPGTPWLSVPETIAFPELERLSEGKFLTKIYGGGVMGEDTEILKKMSAGQLDCCGCTALGVLESCPEASVLLLPGLFNNYEEVDYICEKFRKRLDEDFEKKGYILWALIDTGFFYIFSTTRTTGLADLRKSKVSTWFGTIETTLFNELGITPTPVAVPDIVSALHTGQAEANVAPAAWMLGMQAYQYTNYYLKPPLLYSPAAVIVSADKKEKLQKQLGVSATFAHNIMEMHAAEWNAVEPEWKHQIRAYEEKSLKAFETKCGMKAVTFSTEDQETIKKADKAVQQKLAGKIFPNDLINDIQRALEEYRAQKH